jgi:formylglycine-generating enzyme required for sulfatase activity
MGQWADALQPVRGILSSPLAEVLQEEGRGATERRALAAVYARWAEGLPDAFTPLEKVLPKQPNPKAEDNLALARRQANATAALAAMGGWEKVRPVLQHSPDPTVRSYLIERLAGMVEGRTLAGVLEQEPDVSIRRALLLALGDYDRNRLPPAEQALLIPRLAELYRSDPDPGIHGAAGWLLRQWGQRGKVQEIDRDLATGKVEGQRRWYVNGQQQTMVIVPPGEFWMGEGNERQRRRIDRRFALAAREVTVEQFRHFHKNHQYMEQWSPTVDCPVNAVSWYDAAAYCNWLSQKEGIPRDQWCYVPREKGEYGPGMKVAADYLKRTGYRLPTEAEWEYACRAGGETVWSHGEAEDVLGRYAWFAANALGCCHPAGSLRPNDWGFFDLHGNAWEWCQDRWDNNKTRDGEDKKDIKCIQDKDRRLLRGGAFDDGGVYVRCAYCVFCYGPAYPLNDRFGFRPAKTFR